MGGSQDDLDSILSGLRRRRRRVNVGGRRATILDWLKGSPGSSGGRSSREAAPSHAAWEAKAGGSTEAGKAGEATLARAASRGSGAPAPGAGAGSGGASSTPTEAGVDAALEARGGRSAGAFSWYDPTEYYVAEATGYLMDVRYEGKLGKAVALIYDPAKGRIVKWVDRTGHRPYFLTNLSPDEIRERGKRVESHKSFLNYEVVVKFDPIRRERRKFTKVVVADPLAVKDLRSRFEEPDEGAWEADIKYHHNYIYDNKLIPTMKYRVGARGWEPLDWSVSEETRRNILKIFSDEDKQVQETALEWFPIFEQPPPDPPMAAFDIEVDTPESGKVPDPDNPVQPVISIALVASDGFRKVYLLRRPGRQEEKPDVPAEVEFFDSEIDLIESFFRDLVRYPVVLTFNGDKFDLPYLYNRLRYLGVNPQRIPLVVHQDYYSIDWGVHIDLHKLFGIKALQAYAFGNKYRELSLDAISEALLGERKIELSDTVSNISYSELARYNLRDADLTLRLATFGGNLVWNLIVLLARISKLGLEDVTRTQVSGWVRSLLYWEHRRRGWLIPRRQDIAHYGNIARSTAVIKDKKYKGAIVLTPPQGVFFNIIVLDFASLYPSIIKNWNLSYETVNNPFCKGPRRKVPDVGHEVCMAFQGITSEIVGLLRDFRVRIYKKKAKQQGLSEAERLWYDVVQSAMKVFINASYGVFGSEAFSLYSLAVAESVTAIGRTVLLDTLRKAEELNLHIIYGDTDSLFLWNPRREAMEELIRYVKEKHGLDLEVDKAFKVALFSGLKKNYIGISEDGKVTVKGMVAKKSNTPEFIKKEFRRVLDIMATVREPEDVFKVMVKVRDYVRDIRMKLKKREYTLDELAFRVTLTKDPDEYKKNTPQHVKAALQLRKEGVPVAKGTIVTFVKTRDAVGVKPVSLAKLSEVDVSKYYEYIKTGFEQMLLALGVRWEELSGVKSLEAILGGQQGAPA
ncbi:DNA-directed DNA polymerase I [Stetteria hydrogenophila]